MAGHRHRAARHRRLIDGDAYTAFQGRVAALVRPVLDDIQWSPVAAEGELRAKLRGLLLVMLAVLGNDTAAQDAVALCSTTPPPTRS